MDLKNLKKATPSDVPAIKWQDVPKDIMKEPKPVDKDRLFQLHLIDVVWGHIWEDESVPGTARAERLIEQAKESFDEAEVR